MKTWSLKKIVLWVIAIVLAVILVNSVVTYYQENGSADAAPANDSLGAAAFGGPKDPNPGPSPRPSPGREDEDRFRAPRLVDVDPGDTGGGWSGSGNSGSSFGVTVGGATLSPGIKNGMPVVRVKWKW